MKDKVTGAVFKTTKGAPHVILKLIHDNAVITQVDMQYYRCLERFLNGS